MKQLQILTQFSQLFDEVQESLQNYNDNLRNELFEMDILGTINKYSLHRMLRDFFL